MSYQVVGLLGRGSMSVVELAVDDAGRRVARKRVPLWGSAAEIEMARRRLRREAEVVASLEHPAIVPLLAVEDDGTDVVLIMPEMAGSLSDRVYQRGPAPASEIWRLAAPLLDALSWAHRHGIVHRDIKPANVLFDADGRPALADFGVAVTRDLTGGLTDTGALVGTPAFIAPEQARGEPATPASDIFSLGATLFYALTGAGPYGNGEPYALALRAARGLVSPLPPGVPTSLARPLAAMLDPRPQRRPSAAALLGGATGTVVDPAARPRRPRPPRRRRIADARGPATGDAVRGARFRSPTGVAKPAAGRVLRGIGRALYGPDHRRPPTHRRRRRVIGAVAAVGLVAAATWTATILAGGSGHPALPSAAATRAAVCAPLPYEPCGSPAAPHTDGLACQAGWYDLDSSTVNGCEATADGVNGTQLVSGRTISANLVPVGEVDTYPTRVDSDALAFCWGSLTVTLTAPPGVTDRVQVRNGSHVLATATSRDGRPATATVGKPSCFGGDGQHDTVTVSGVLGQTGADYTLSRNGGW